MGHIVMTTSKAIRDRGPWSTFMEVMYRRKAMVILRQRFYRARAQHMNILTCKARLPFGIMTTLSGSRGLMSTWDWPAST